MAIFNNEIHFNFVIMRLRIKIISLVICFLFLFTTIPSTESIKTICYNDNEDKQYTNVYFVIGIGIHIYGGTWPMYDAIFPILFIRLGSSGLDILGPKSSKCIDFMKGDKLIGYYPFFNPVGIGFVCGLWIDMEDKPQV
jgi:hypothetical protein